MQINNEVIGCTRLQHRGSNLTEIEFPDLAKLLSITCPFKTRLQEVKFYIATGQQQLSPNFTPIGIKLQATMHQFQAILLNFMEKFNKAYHTTINSL